MIKFDVYSISCELEMRMKILHAEDKFINYLS